VKFPLNSNKICFRIVSLSGRRPDSGNSIVLSGANVKSGFYLATEFSAKNPRRAKSDRISREIRSPLCNPKSGMRLSACLFNADIGRCAYLDYFF